MRVDGVDLLNVRGGVDKNSLAYISETVPKAQRVYSMVASNLAAFILYGGEVIFGFTLNCSIFGVVLWRVTSQFALTGRTLVDCGASTRHIICTLVGENRK